VPAPLRSPASPANARKPLISQGLFCFCGQPLEPLGAKPHADSSAIIPTQFLVSQKAKLALLSGFCVQLPEKRGASGLVLFCKNSL
jgi:hypothetical protein